MGELCQSCGHDTDFHYDSHTRERVPCEHISEVGNGHINRCNCSVVSTNKTTHYSEGKPAFHLIAVEMLLELAKVLAFGAKKYGEFNWQKGTYWSEFYGSTLRHVYAWWGGEDLDKESGLHHLAHAICNLMFLIWYQRYSVGKDDRRSSSVTTTGENKE